MLDARNDVAHLGLIGHAGAHLVAFLKAVELLRSSLDLDRAAYWGEFTGSVDAALDQAAKQARVAVETARAVARNEFSRRYGHLTDPTRDAVIHAIEASYQLNKYEEVIVDCPACECLARLAGTSDPSWVQDDEDSASFFVELVPGYFHCNVCDLELDGEDELEAAGISGTVSIEDADPADFYEPDWDDYRDEYR